MKISGYVTSGQRYGPEILLLLFSRMFVSDALLSFGLVSLLLMLSLCCMLYLQDAIKKYDGVVQNLEFARDLQKQFISISAEVCWHILSFGSFVEALSLCDRHDGAMGCCFRLRSKVGVS